MAPRPFEVRQPQPNDVKGSDFTVAGFRTGFEATVLWQLLDKDGQSEAQGNIQGTGFMGVIRDFGHQGSVGGYTARAAQMTLQVFGDGPFGIHPPGTDLDLVPVTLSTALEGFRLYEVVAGDTLTKVAREHGPNPTVEDVFSANRDRINNPDLIFSRSDLPYPRGSPKVGVLWRRPAEAPTSYRRPRLAGMKMAVVAAGGWMPTQKSASPQTPELQNSAKEWSQK